MKCLHTSDINAALLYVLDSCARVWVFSLVVDANLASTGVISGGWGGDVVAAQAAGHRRHH
ncbi:hypothetical protein P3T40_000227 [Paraburkholderia sp. EB58]|jgi:hypothetical protein